MRAVIYARYSSDLRSAVSIEDQIRLCRERIEQENRTVVDVYADYAISGSSLRNRPRMQRLLEQAKKGKFDCVIAEALDRVSRDQEDNYKRLRHSDIRFLTLAEGEISELHVGLKGTVNALFLKDLALKIRRGQRGRVEVGKVPGGSSYGYRIIRQLRADGSVSTEVPGRARGHCEVTTARWPNPGLRPKNDRRLGRRRRLRSNGSSGPSRPSRIAVVSTAGMRERCFMSVFSRQDLDRPHYHPPHGSVAVLRGAEIRKQRRQVAED